MTTTSPRVDVDRIARRAMREVNKPNPDLLTAGFPFEPGWVNLIVEPIPPRTVSDGGIEMVDDSLTAEGFQCTVARVLKVGPAAMEGVTASGIKLCNFRPDIQTPEQLIGKYVIFQLHTGQELVLRRTGQKIRVMKVTDLLGVTHDPQAWKFYI
jgi:hypothetical protein